MSRDFDALETGRLTWVGLSVAAIGWALLLAVTAMADAVALRLAPSSPTLHADLHAALHADLIGIAKCLIGSGFALALIGTLQAGFGALNRFFGAVLTRSSQRVVEPQPAPFDAGLAGLNAAGGAMDKAARQRRPYRTFADGSVEVETILGTRRFDTMSDAREFI